MIERAFDQGFRTGLAIFLEQVFFETAGIHADPDRAAIGLGRRNHFLHPRFAADIAGIDPQAGGAAIGRFERALIVEMDIGNDRHLGRARNLLECRG